MYCLSQLLRPRRAGGFLGFFLGVTGFFLTCSVHADLSPEEQETLQTVIAGMRHRENLIQSISGTALRSHFQNEAAREIIDTLLESIRQPPQPGTYGDRGRALYRFRLGRQQWFYDLQQLWWGGGGGGGVFVEDFQRQPQEVADLYKREYCDGDRIYLYRRCKDPARGGSGTITSREREIGGVLRTPFSLWFALGRGQTYSTELEEALQKGWVVEVKEETLED